MLVENELKAITTVKRGAGCSVEGNRYEKQIHDIVCKCRLPNGLYFNTQTSEQLGGSNSTNDIECNWESEKDVPIEIKKMKTPDWMQCSLKFDETQNKWIASSKNKIPDGSKHIFELFVENKKNEIFNGKIPPFMTHDITHSEWVQIKKNTTDFNDVYMDCPGDTIQRLYSAKNCKYIQVSGKGLYHLGEDVCGFGVPQFVCEQEFRFRTKIHATSNSRGFCSLSVIIACKPKNIVVLEKSIYSLDDVMQLPPQLQYIE
jgi:hypothetical protein